MSDKSAKPLPANTSGSEELSDNDLQAVAGGVGLGISPVPIGIDQPIAIVPLPIGPPLPSDIE